MGGGSDGLRERPFPRAYARWREAEAMLDNGRPRSIAEPVLQEAVSVARQLGARCLLAELESLARRARIELRDNPHPSTALRRRAA